MKTGFMAPFDDTPSEPFITINSTQYTTKYIIQYSCITACPCILPPIPAIVRGTVYVRGIVEDIKSLLLLRIAIFNCGTAFKESSIFTFHENNKIIITVT
jgi:hypothetical protein